MAVEAGGSVQRKGVLDAFLTTVARVANEVPHPAIVFFIPIAIVIALSVILSLVGWSATYEAVDPATHEVVTRTTTVRSLLSADGIGFIFTAIVPNFMGFGAVGVVIVALVGVVSSIADAGYLVLVPLGAAAFHGLGRHPLEWAIVAPAFIPPFMRLGGDPDMVLAAYRVGDSPANVITPLNVHLGVMVGFAAEHQKDAGIGTIVSLMLPYTVVLLVLWTALLGLPLGPA